MVELPAAGAAAEPPPVLGADCDGANVAGGADGEPFDELGPWRTEGAEAAGPDGNDGICVAGPGTTVLGAADAAHDEQPEPVLSGAEITPLTPHEPEAHDGAATPHAPDAHDGA